MLLATHLVSMCWYLLTYVVKKYIARGNSKDLQDFIYKTREQDPNITLQIKRKPKQTEDESKRVKIT